MTKKEEDRITFTLQELIAEKVYKTVMDMHWQKIEEFRSEMGRKIDAASRAFAKEHAEELAKTIKKLEDEERTKTKKARGSKSTPPSTDRL